MMDFTLNPSIKNNYFLRIQSACIQRASSHPHEELALGTPYVRAADALRAQIPELLGEAVAMECNAVRDAGQCVKALSP